MDVDVFVHRHRPAWDRLALLVRQRSLTGSEADELVALYQLTSVHLSRLQAVAPDPAVVGGLSDLVARARARALGTRTGVVGDVVGFVTRSFPAALYRSWPWWVSVAAVFLVLSSGIGAWIASDEGALGSVATPAEFERITAPGGEFETYYSEYPAGSFGAQVWTNNAWVAAVALFTGVLIFPAVYVLFMNAVNLGVTGGMMAAAGRLDAFFGFIAPHGMLELTAVFVASGAGLKLGWTLIDPGEQSRVRALARQGQATAGLALGLVAVLFVSGFIEAFVTPSGLPTAVRIGIGAAAEAAFLGYVFGLGRYAAAGGVSGAHASFDSHLEPTAEPGSANL